MAEAGSNRKVFRVAEITRLIKALLEDELGAVWIEGEISNFRQPASGHCYFTLKDESAQIRAVLFRGNQARLRFALKDGLQVRVFGEVSVYERSGEYQIIIRQVEEAGQGSLQARFEALKEKLLKEGLFEESRKKRLPLLPQHVGIVTSSTGAAIRDILQILNRRFPNLHVVLVPVRVQGEGAAAEIAAAIDLLNARGGFDVMIVGRGGGSLEDLWAFNEEVVARAIARSAIPVISAVGHEIDFTISDFVADLRAPTPSAAAELLVNNKEAFEGRLADMAKALRRTIQECAATARQRLLRLAGHYVFREPRNVVRQHLQQLDGLSLRMTHELESAVGVRRQRLETCSARLSHRMQGGVQGGRQALEEFVSTMLHRLELGTRSARLEIKRLDTQLKALSPLAVLQRGYSVTRDEQGRIVRRAADVKAGQRVMTRVARGHIESEVKTTHDDNA